MQLLRVSSYPRRQRNQSIARGRSHPELNEGVRYVQHLLARRRTHQIRKHRDTPNRRRHQVPMLLVLPVSNPWLPDYLQSTPHFHCL